MYNNMGESVKKCDFFVVVVVVGYIVRLNVSLESDCLLRDFSVGMLLPRLRYFVLAIFSKG